MTTVGHTAAILARGESIYHEVLHSHGVKLICQRGCHWCCYEPVEVHASELEVVGQAVRELGRATVRRVQQKAIKLARRVHKENIGLADGDANRYRAMNALCPLCEDGECIVYSARPLVCRLHGVQDRVDLCRPDRTEHNQTAVKCQELMGGAYMAFGSGKFVGLPGGLAMVLGNKTAPVAVHRHHGYDETVKAIQEAAADGLEMASSIVKIAVYLEQGETAWQ